MATKQAEEKPSEQQKPEGGQLEARVRENVISGLGRPSGPYRVQVRCVWPDHYRVNVFIGADVASLTVAHSFFLKADGTGKILTSSPAIAKAY